MFSICPLGQKKSCIITEKFVFDLQYRQICVWPLAQKSLYLTFMFSVGTHEPNAQQITDKTEIGLWEWGPETVREP